MLTLVVFGKVDLILPSQAESRHRDEREYRCNDHHGEEVGVVGESHRCELESEQPFDEQPRKVDALDAEEASGEHYDGEGAYDCRDSADALVEFPQE